MGKISIKTEFAAPADQVWSLIKGFNGPPKWHPAFKSGEVEPLGKGRDMRWPADFETKGNPAMDVHQAGFDNVRKILGR